MKSKGDQQEILRRLRLAIADRVPVDPAQISPDSKFSDIGIDSFSLIELVFLAEEEFGITIPLVGLTVNTVGDVLDEIALRVNSPRSN